MNYTMLAYSLGLVVIASMLITTPLHRRLTKFITRTFVVTGCLALVLATTFIIHLMQPNVGG